jgi:hypothetical protein
VIIFTISPCLKVEEKITGKSFGISLHILAVPGHALLWLSLVKWKRKKRESARTVHTFRRLPWPLTISVGADYSPSTLANYSLGSRWLTLQTNCSATMTTTPVTVGSQPKVAFVGPDRSHPAQPFRYALSRVGCWGNVCCLFTMHSSGFILGIANRYHGYNIVSLRRCVAVMVYLAVG